MPASFRNVMLRHKEEILQGCLTPDDKGESAHRYDPVSKSGYLLDRIQELSAAIPVKIHDHVPFRKVAVDFGSLSHYISDLNDPTVICDSDKREKDYRADFAMYFEKNIDQFTWVYYGHEDEQLNQGHIPEFVYGIAARSEKQYPYLGDSYYPNGVRVSSDTFDPKSLPFGIASLAWSHSISNTVQIWFDCWRRAHGDTEHTPFLRSSKKH